VLGGPPAFAHWCYDQGRFLLEIGRQPAPEAPIPRPRPALASPHRVLLRTLPAPPRRGGLTLRRLAALAWPAASLVCSSRCVRLFLRRRLAQRCRSSPGVGRMVQPVPLPGRVSSLSRRKRGRPRGPRPCPVDPRSPPRERPAVAWPSPVPTLVRTAVRSVIASSVPNIAHRRLDALGNQGFPQPVPPPSHRHDRTQCACLDCCPEEP